MGTFPAARPRGRAVRQEHHPAGVQERSAGAEVPGLVTDARLL